jgi:DNA-binding NarL/FixJ family response regulator
VIRTVVVDDHPAMTAGLTAVLRAEPGFLPVGAAGHEAELWPLLERTAPDVVLLDYHLPGTDGLQLCRRVTAAPGAPGVVLYSAYADGMLALAARVAGAHAIASKGAPAGELFDLLRRVARGEHVLPDIAPEHLSAAAHRVDDEDLPLLSMLVELTPGDDVCDALRLQPSELQWRTDRLLGRLRVEVPASARA